MCAQSILHQRSSLQEELTKVNLCPPSSGETLQEFIWLLAQGFTNTGMVNCISQTILHCKYFLRSYYEIIR